MGAQDAPGSSAYTMYRDPDSDPPTIVCQVGGPKLLYDARAIAELHAMLKAYGDWMPLGGADEQKPALRARSRRGADPSPIPAAAGTGSRRISADDSVSTSHLSLRNSASPSSPITRRTTRRGLSAPRPSALGREPHLDVLELIPGIETRPARRPIPGLARQRGPAT